VPEREGCRVAIGAETKTRDVSRTAPEPPGIRIAVLVWGLLGSLVFTIGSVVIATTEVSRAEREIIGVFQEGERTTHLIGNIGYELARSRLMLREAVSKGSLTEARRVVPVIDAAVGAREDELARLLGPDERRLWVELEPKIKQLRNDLLQALSALEQAEIERADRALDGLLPNSLAVQNQLTELSQRNRTEIKALLEGTARRLEVVRLLEVTMGGVLVVTIGIAWLAAIKTIRRQRQRIKTYIHQIETAKNDLDAFAGRIAHDLKNVLGPVAMSTEALKRAAGKPDATERHLQRLQRSSMRATELLDALLAFSRAGKPVDEHAVSWLKEEVESCLEDLKNLAERVGATVRVELRDDLCLPVGSSLLRAVISNLLSNALKFLEGRERREVWISARSEDEQRCLFIVEDTGPGIPEGSLPKLFDPFYRVPGTAAPGTGIGLATVHRIVQAHSGHIHATSIVGAGARFEIRLPLAPTERPKATSPVGNQDLAPEAQPPVGPAR
jgi:signal transduction histidine kinase